LEDIKVLEKNGLLGNQREFHVNGRTPKARREQLNILRKHSAAKSLPSGVTIFMHDMPLSNDFMYDNVHTMLSTAVSVIVLDHSRNAVTMFYSVKELLSAVESYEDPERAGVDNRMPRFPRFPSDVPAGAQLRIFSEHITSEHITRIRETPFFNSQGERTNWG
jgi:hypothetical protein